jgi:hypothetical protein
VLGLGAQLTSTLPLTNPPGIICMMLTQ